MKSLCLKSVKCDLISHTLLRGGKDYSAASPARERPLPLSNSHSANNTKWRQRIAYRFAIRKKLISIHILKPADQSSAQTPRNLRAWRSALQGAALLGVPRIPVLPPSYYYIHFIHWNKISSKCSLTYCLSVKCFLSEHFRDQGIL